MDGQPQEPTNLEDRVRRMILFNGSVPDEAAFDTRPRVRLPPSHPSPTQPSAGPYQHGHDGHARYMSNGSAGPAPPHNAAYPSPLVVPSPQQPTSAFGPPHLRYTGPQQHQPNWPPPGNQPTRPSYSGPAGGRGRGNFNQRQQRNQHLQLDPDAFRRNGPGAGQGRPPPNARNLYDPNARNVQPRFIGRDVARQRQAQYLDQIATREIVGVDMSTSERQEKEAFRVSLQKVCDDVCEANPHLPAVSLECFGSFQSGFASAGSDMDLAIVVRDNKSADACFSILESDLPRSLEKQLLKAGIGARLLTRTRVPIIKICQRPSPSLLENLREEREKWDGLPEEKKYPHLFKDDEAGAEDESVPTTVQTPQIDGRGAIATSVSAVAPALDEQTNADPRTVEVASVTVKTDSVAVDAEGKLVEQPKRDQHKVWTRERKAGPLDFPKDGIGIQCDINFFNPLGLHNTQLLRCYSKCDPRVRPIILLVKSWAKQRKINSSYSGTLSSYGYVLMVLHYLVNIAHPRVLPNLQHEWRPSPNCTPPSYNRTEVDGWVVDFWRNEDEIENALRNGQMSSNQDSLGSLLAGFFHYYSSQSGNPQFRWTTQVLSLRTPGGIVSKEQKGWVKATTEEGEGRKIQHRYLFCIEDPFELSHNVARTVTHNGIVAIRDEFRRASRILSDVGQGAAPQDGELFAKLLETEDFLQATEVPKKQANEVAFNANAHVSTVDNGAGKQVLNRSNLRPQGKQYKQDRSENGHTSQTPSNPAHAHQALKNAKATKPSQVNVNDQESFPTLGEAKSKPRKQQQQKRAGSGPAKESGNFHEISGDQAAAYLDDFRRKKAEDALESTAHGAAEAVLDGTD